MEMCLCSQSDTFGQCSAVTINSHYPSPTHRWLNDSSSSTNTVYKVFSHSVLSVSTAFPLLSLPPCVPLLPSQILFLDFSLHFIILPSFLLLSPVSCLKKQTNKQTKKQSYFASFCSLNLQSQSYLPSFSMVFLIPLLFSAGSFSPNTHTHPRLSAFSAALHCHFCCNLVIPLYMCHPPFLLLGSSGCVSEAVREAAVSSSPWAHLTDCFK